MHVIVYPDAAAFLRRTQPFLEACGAEGDLLLGMCLRMAALPGRAATLAHFLAVLEGEAVVLPAVLVPPWSLVVHGLAGDLGEVARALAAGYPAGWPPAPGVEGPAAVAGLVAARLAEASDRRMRLERRQLLYEARAVRTPVPGQGRLRLATEAELPLAAQWWHGSSLAAFGRADRDKSERAARRHVAAGALYLWDTGRPVSMAVKTSPTPAGITVGRVYTPPEERGRGYATACVGELSRLLLAEGRSYCTLFAEVGNAPAQRVYERVGYRRVSEFAEIALEE
ncbi:MAG TPA: GNAT family N-acetyltransferase [Anaerolineae bacterium]|nr:GNAT family N-acetyltransferase [Anaerolineae bacterium]